MAANVLGFLTSKFSEIASQHPSPFQGLNHHIPGVPSNYRTPPRPRNYSGVPIPYFGGDTINIDEEIAVGTSFSASENSDVEVEVLTSVHKDANQESKSGDSGAQEVTDPSPRTRKIFSFFAPNKRKIEIIFFGMRFLLDHILIFG